MELSKSRLNEPIIKGRNYKSRNASKEKPKDSSSKTKLKSNITKLDEPYD